MLTVNSCRSLQTLYTLCKDLVFLLSDHKRPLLERCWIYYCSQSYDVRSHVACQDFRICVARRHAPPPPLPPLPKSNAVTWSKLIVPAVWLCRDRCDGWVLQVLPPSASLLLHVDCSTLHYVTWSSLLYVEHNSWTELKLAYWPLWNAFWEYPLWLGLMGPVLFVALRCSNEVIV